MSEMEYHTGSIYAVYRPHNVTLEEQARLICKSKGWHNQNGEYLWTDILREDGYDEYIIIDDDIYAFQDHKSIDSYVCEAWYGEGIIIGFNLAFYNGGCGFEEALETAVKELKERN